MPLRRRSEPDVSVYCASPKAVVAAAVGWAKDGGMPVPAVPLANALIAAHHPNLGLDRSVCLRDVVEALRNGQHPVHGYGPNGHLHAAAFLEREFGNGRLEGTE